MRRGAKITRIGLGRELAGVSSSGVRNHVQKEGVGKGGVENERYRPPWVSDAVADFILETGLYRKGSSDGLSLYEARKRLLNRLFSCSSPEEFGIGDMKREAERLCGRLR